MTVCPACRHSVEPASRFCSACGAALNGAEPMRAGLPDGLHAGHEHHPGPGDTTIDAGPSLLHPSEAATPAVSLQPDEGRFPPGTLIHDRYRISGRVGFGGMGVVYRADDLKLGQPVALKFLARHAADDPRRAQRFLNEVRIARQISHPHVCRVYDIGDFEGQTYISMEFVDGENLSDLTRRIGRLPHAKAIDVAHQLCLGLAAAHALGIIHRDLKPANIMIDGRGQVRITDFGLAALAAELNPDDSRAGTPAYMSPEQLSSGQVGVHSDIYSLGLVLYELFTGQRAFPAETITRLRDLQGHVETIRPRLSAESLDRRIAQTVLQCLNVDSARRPRSAIAVARGLPGGEVLQAALAAGDASQLEMLIGSPQAQGVQPVVAMACLVVVLLGLGLYPLLSDQIKLHGLTQLDRSPEVLAHTAREILERSGRLLVPVDHAYGLEADRDYLKWIESNDASPDRWARLSLGRPPAVRFWYRESPVTLTPTIETGRILARDPPIDQPGMTSVELDGEGRLLRLLVIPGGGPTPPPRATATDWNTVLRPAGFQAPRFTPMAPRGMPPVYCDERAAWRGTFSEAEDLRVVMEAAALGGRIVFFETRYDFGSDPAGLQLAAERWSQAQQIAQGVLLSLVLIGAVMLARRNIALGRGDQQEAMQVAGTVGLLMLMSWLLQADHVADFPRQFAHATGAAGKAVLFAAVAWLFYVAFEPHALRGWPDMLISWKRLLSGFWSDPLIGRDILTGAVFGVFAMILTAARYFIPPLIGALRPAPRVDELQAMLGVRYALAGVADSAVAAILWPMFLLVVLLLFLLVLRTRTAALVGFALATTAMLTLAERATGPDLLATGLYYAALIGALIFVLMRFGLLALVFALFFSRLMQEFPITANFSAWYISATWTAWSVAVGMLFYGFVTAIGNQPLIRGEVIRD